MNSGDMNILQVTRQYYPAVGGIQAAILNLSLQIQQEHAVTILALNRLFTPQKTLLPNSETINGIPVKRIPYFGPKQYAIAPQVLSISRDFDFLHLHSSDFFLDYLAFTKPIHRKPIVLTSHGAYFHTVFAQPIKKIYFHTMTRLNLRAVSKVICVSEHDFNLFSKIAPNEKLILIPNGINLETFKGFETRNRDPNLVITVGRLAPNKRNDLMLKTFARVVDKNPKAKLIIIGPDMGMMPNLKSLCASLNLTNFVSFLGKVSNEELEKYLQRASVWLSSASYEAFGIALLEAMAAGCIPVTSSIPSFSQLIQHGKSGYITDFNQPAHAAKCILNALTLPKLEREQIIIRARQKADQFSWSTIGDRILKEVYSEII